jgi:ADP-ribosylglycohydrolase
LHRTLAEIRPGYQFNESCQGTVPEAIIAFLESNDFVHTIQLAISVGGDTDTLACIAGGIAEAFYRDIPKELIDFVNSKLTVAMQRVVGKFQAKYHIVQPCLTSFSSSSRKWEKGSFLWQPGVDGII